MKADGALQVPEELDRLLEAERFISPLPTDVRLRAMARARAALTALPAPTVTRSPRYGARLAVAAGAALFLTAAGAAALQERWTFVAKAEPVAARLDTADAPAPTRVRRPVRVPAQEASTWMPAAPATVARRAKTPVARDRDIARYDLELALLGKARASVLAGYFDQALGHVAQHARQFPAGAFAEEREVLRVRSLAGLGRRDEARAAAAAFQVRFPRSALLAEMRDRSR